MYHKLVVGIDIRDLKVAKTGTKTYLVGLCEAFKKLESNSIRFHFIDTHIPVYTGNNKFRKLLEHINYHLWKQLVLPIKAWLKGCNIVFCTDTYVPYIHLGYHTVPVFHDAFLFENPEHYNSIWLKVYLYATMAAAKRSSKIICPTEYSKERIIHYTGIANNHIITVYEGIKRPNIIHKQDAIHLLSQLGLIKQQYLLHVGVMDKRKNIPKLISAFKKVSVKYPYLKLVLIGSTSSKKHGNDFKSIANIIKELDLKNKVVLTGYLSDVDVSKIYSMALLYVFPSVNEGFGIPVLESFYHQIPVLVANNTCLIEVGGDAIVTFNPFSDDNIAEQLVKVINDPSLRMEMIKRGIKRLENFTWDKSAQQLLDIFKSIHQKS